MVILSDEKAGPETITNKISNALASLTPQQLNLSKLTELLALTLEDNHTLLCEFF